MSILGSLAKALQRMVTLPSGYNSLGDVRRDPLGAIASLATGVAQGATAAGTLGVGVPAWAQAVARFGAVVAPLQAAREQQKLAAAMMSGMRQNSERLATLIAALNAMPPPASQAARTEAMMRANLQTMMQQARRQAPAGVDISGALNLMQARGLAQIANMYNQQAFADEQARQAEYLRRLQLQAGIMGDVFGQQQALYGMAMNQQQILQQAVGNALLTFSQLLPATSGRRLTPEQQTALQTLGTGLGVGLNAVGLPAVGASLWGLGRRR